MTVPQPRRCKDCVREGVATLRPTVPGPGPRCATHQRAWRRRRREQLRNSALQRTYEISQELYDAILEEQGGVCAMCQVANGKTKRLAVDHDHDLCDDHPRDKACRRCIRGLLCGPDNVTIGRLRAAGLIRGIEYLYNPPARKVLNS